MTWRRAGSAPETQEWRSMRRWLQLLRVQRTQDRRIACVGRVCCRSLSAPPRASRSACADRSWLSPVRSERCHPERKCPSDGRYIVVVSHPYRPLPQGARIAFAWRLSRRAATMSLAAIASARTVPGTPTAPSPYSGPISVEIAFTDSFDVLTAGKCRGRGIFAAAWTVLGSRSDGRRPVPSSIPGWQRPHLHDMSRTIAGTAVSTTAAHMRRQRFLHTVAPESRWLRVQAVMAG